MPNALPADHHKGYRHPFLFGIHYLGGVGDNPRTLSELAMSQFSAELRRKPEWWKSFQNQDARSSWAKEARKSLWNVRTPSSSAEVQLSEKQIDYVLDELAGYKSLLDEANGCQVSCFERIWESDSLLESATIAQLQEKLGELQKDSLHLTRRNEDGVTISVIEPMLYSLVYNQTLVSNSSHRPPRSLSPPPSTDIYTVCSQFAYLPADVWIPADGSPIKFSSYINNLHPENSLLYNLLETCLSGFIPLFEHTLTDLHRNNPLTQRILGPCTYTIWDEPECPEFSDDEDGWLNYEREVREWVMNRPLQLPDVPNAGYLGGLEHRKHIVTLKGRNVQVVLRVSKVHLTPQGPSFPGSEWHAEGMRSERIVACGIHVLSSENLTSSSLQFRMAVTYPRGFFAGDTGATLRTWGLTDGDSCHQYIGSVPVRPGLSLVFPNIYQHRHTPFEILDSTKEGEMTLIHFLLVDPDIKPIVSTSSVGPQQKTWIRKALNESLDPRLPIEVLDNIMEHTEGLMTDEEAGVYRQEMIKSRARFTQCSNNYHFCIPFDIWNGPDFAH